MVSDIFACSFLTGDTIYQDAAAPFIGFEDVQTTMNIKAMTGVTLSSVTLQQVQHLTAFNCYLEAQSMNLDTVTAQDWSPRSNTMSLS